MCDFKDDPCPMAAYLNVVTTPFERVASLTTEQKWDAAKEVVLGLATHYKNLADRLEAVGSSESYYETRAVQRNFEKLFDWFESVDQVPLDQRTFSV